jgi:putative flippase GtrA
LREVGVRLGRVSSEAGTGRLGLQVAMFLVIGVLSTIAYAALYLGLRQVTGAMEANLVALLVTAIANTAANRRFSFGVRGPQGRLRHQVQGLAVFALGLAFTSAVLWLMPAAHPTLEVVALTAANLLVTVLRFSAMKLWIFVRRVETRPTLRR